jgi:hypothetical protein
MTINDEITAIANNLANKGQKPSVALIKTKLSCSVPLPTIISVLKTWTHQTDNLVMNEDTKQKVHSENVDKDPLLALISLALQPLQQEITELRHKIDKLTEQLK